MKKHMSTHTGQKRCYCEIPADKLAQSSHLKEIMFTHPGVKRF